MDKQAGVIVVLSKNGDQLQKVPLRTNTPCTFGSNTEARVRLEQDGNTKLEGIHCVVNVDSKGFAVLVNKSRLHPTVLNGKSLISEKVLINNDIFEVCGRKFQYVNSRMTEEKAKLYRKQENTKHTTLKSRATMFVAPKLKTTPSPFPPKPKPTSSKNTTTNSVQLRSKLSLSAKTVRSTTKPTPKRTKSATKPKTAYSPVQARRLLFNKASSKIPVRNKKVTPPKPNESLEEAMVQKIDHSSFNLIDLESPVEYFSPSAPRDVSNKSRKSSANTQKRSATATPDVEESSLSDFLKNESLCKSSKRPSRRSSLRRFVTIRGARRKPSFDSSSAEDQTPSKLNISPYELSEVSPPKRRSRKISNTKARARSLPKVLKARSAKKQRYSIHAAAAVSKKTLKTASGSEEEQDVTTPVMTQSLSKVSVSAPRIHHERKSRLDEAVNESVHADDSVAETPVIHESSRRSLGKKLQESLIMASPGSNDVENREGTPPSSVMKSRRLTDVYLLETPVRANEFYGSPKSAGRLSSVKVSMTSTPKEPARGIKRQLQSTLEEVEFNKSRRSTRNVSVAYSQEPNELVLLQSSLSEPANKKGRKSLRNKSTVDIEEPTVDIQSPMSKSNVRQSRKSSRNISAVQFEEPEKDIRPQSLLTGSDVRKSRKSSRNSSAVHTAEPEKDLQMESHLSESEGRNSRKSSRDSYAVHIQDSENKESPLNETKVKISRKSSRNSSAVHIEEPEKDVQQQSLNDSDPRKSRKSLRSSSAVHIEESEKLESPLSEAHVRITRKSLRNSSQVHTEEQEKDVQLRSPLHESDVGKSRKSLRNSSVVHIEESGEDIQLQSPLSESDTRKSRKSKRGSSVKVIEEQQENDSASSSLHFADASTYIEKSTLSDGECQSTTASSWINETSFLKIKTRTPLSEKKELQNTPSSKENIVKLSISGDHACDISGIGVLYVSPEPSVSKKTPRSRLGAKEQKTPKNDLTDIKGVKKLMQTPKAQNSPKNDLTNIVGVKSLFEDPKIRKSPKNDLTNIKGVKKLMQTPKVRRSPRNDLTNIVGVKTLFEPPKTQKSPKNDLTDIRGVKRLMRTPKPQKSPENDLTNIVTVKTLFEPPKNEKSPKNDLTDIKGVKKLMRTPKAQRSPKNDLTNIASIKTLFEAPRPNKSPKNDLTAVQGVKKLMRTPQTQKSPKNDLTNVVSVKTLFQSPKNPKLPRNDLTNLPNLRKLMQTPRERKSPRNDLTRPYSRRLLRTPKQQKSPKSDLTEVRGVKKLLRTPRERNEPKNDLSDVSGVKGLFEREEQNLTAADAFDRLLERKPIITYRGKSFSPVMTKSVSTTLSASYTEEGVEDVKPDVEKWVAEQRSLKRKSSEKLETEQPASKKRANKATTSVVTKRNTRQKKMVQRESEGEDITPVTTRARRGKKADEEPVTVPTPSPEKPVRTRGRLKQHDMKVTEPESPPRERLLRTRGRNDQEQEKATGSIEIEKPTRTRGRNNNKDKKESKRTVVDIEEETATPPPKRSVRLRVKDSNKENDTSAQNTKRTVIDVEEEPVENKRVTRKTRKAEADVEEVEARTRGRPKRQAKKETPVKEEKSTKRRVHFENESVVESVNPPRVTRNRKILNTEDLNEMAEVEPSPVRRSKRNLNKKK